MPEEERRDGEGFLAAWSRRKRAVAREEAQAKQPEKEAANSETAAEADGNPLSSAEPEISAEELAALPPIDEITGSTDLQPFLRRGVPETLRNAAMRKVWLSNSLICDHDDPAVDYAWDWNAPDAVPGASGVLQGDKVSKMMDDLINRNGPETGQKVPEDDALDSESVVPEGEDLAALDAPTEHEKSEDTSQTEPALPTNPLRKSDQSATQDADSNGASDADGEEQHIERKVAATAPVSVPVPVRRHGSAIPE